MMNNTDVISRLLDKYKFSNPLDSTQRSRVLSSRKSSLKKILMLRGEYNLFYGAGIFLNVVLRNGGVRFGMLQVKILLVAGIAVSTGGTAATVYYAEKHFSRPTKTVTIKISDQQISEDKLKPVVEKIQLPIRKIGIQPITTDMLSGVNSGTVTGKIVDQLAILEGESAILSMQRGRKNNCNMMLSGSLTKFNDELILSIRVIDIKTSEVVYLTSEKLNSAGELDSACKAIARSIHQNIKTK